MIFPFKSWLSDEAADWLKANRHRLTEESNAWCNEEDPSMHTDPMEPLYLSLWIDLVGAVGPELAADLVQNAEPMRLRARIEPSQ